MHTTHWVVTDLFVYGTLLPGDVRWPLLERYVTGEGTSDAVAGLLYDTGLDYPAAVFDESATTLIRDRRGGRCRWLLPLRIDSGSLHVIDEALRELDIEEDTVDGLYTRVEVTTQNGKRCWAYAYGTGLNLTPIPSGNWFDRPTRPGQQFDG